MKVGGGGGGEGSRQEGKVTRPESCGFKEKSFESTS